MEINWYLDLSDAVTFEVYRSATSEELGTLVGEDISPYLVDAFGQWGARMECAADPRLCHVTIVRARHHLLVHGARRRCTWRTGPGSDSIELTPTDLCSSNVTY